MFQDHAAKGRSAVIAKALLLLKLPKQESFLAQAYAHSANDDKKMAGEFEAALADGLVNGQSADEGAHAAW